MRLESELERKAVNYAKEQGILALKLNVKGRRGWPDRLYIYMGKFEMVEYKRPGEKPVPIQEYVHRVLAAHKIAVHVIDNWMDARVQLQRMKS